MSKSGLTATQPIEYAGFWRRAVAYVIDYFILVVMTLPITLIGLCAIGSTRGTQDQIDAATNQIALIALFLCMIVVILYFSIFESLMPQATPGKMVMRLEVTDTNGNRPSFTRAFVRNIAKVLSAMFFNLGFLMAAFTGRKQALHDMVAGCLVVRQHPSTETKWKAAHHKHKTSWKDPTQMQDDDAPKNIAAIGNHEKLGVDTAGGQDYSKINLADVAAQPIPAGAVREPVQPKQSSDTSTLPQPSPAVPSQSPHTESTGLLVQPETTGLVPQPESTTLAPPPETTSLSPSPAPQHETATAPPDLQSSLLHADLSLFSAHSAVPADLGSLPSTASTGAATEPDHSQKVCSNCGAIIDKNFSFCLKCMETH